MGSLWWRKKNVTCWFCVCVCQSPLTKIKRNSNTIGATDDSSVVTNLRIVSNFNVFSEPLKNDCYWQALSCHFCKSWRCPCNPCNLIAGNEVEHSVVLVYEEIKRHSPSPADWAEVPVRLNRFFSMDVTEPTRFSELATLWLLRWWWWSLELCDDMGRPRNWLFDLL